VKILYQLTSPMEKTVLGADEVVRRRDFLRQRAALGIEVEVRSLCDGPASIESAWEAALVVPALCESVVRAQAEGFSAVIIGCFSDPGLDALRELTSIPIVGRGPRPCIWRRSSARVSRSSRPWRARPAEGTNACAALPSTASSRPCAA
jgi:hypothetical protein